MFSVNENYNEPAAAGDAARAFEGANHPLAMTVHEALAVHESARISSESKTVIPVAKDGTLPGEKLSPGDHIVQLPDGRPFNIHVPQNDGHTQLPVMFVISPSVNAPSGFDAKNFGPETGMNEQADKDKFVAVYPLPLKHMLGRFSRQEGFAWNAPGTGIHPEDLKFAGYDDVAYMKSIINKIPELANVDSSHKNWGAIAFSQGGMFLNELQHEMPNLFPTLGLVGTTMETNHDYTTAPGNSHNVMIVNLRADKSTLPFPGISNGTWQYNLSKGASEILPTTATMWIAEHLSALGGIDDRNQDPNLQMQLYAKDMKAEGAVSDTRSSLSTPVSNAEKDTLTMIKPADPKNADGLYIYDLPTSEHAYPGPNRGVRINSSPKYTEFDTSAEFAKMFTKYNETTHH